MLRAAAALLVLVGLYACTDDGRTRDTAGGGWRAACLTTNDCGCREQRGTDDPFCEKDGTVQLQCLGSAKVCSLACQLDSECTALFGVNARCNTFDNYCAAN